MRALRRPRARATALAVTGVALILGGWQIVAVTAFTRANGSFGAIPPPGEVARRAVQDLADPGYWSGLSATASSALIGYAIAALAALILGVVVMLLPWLDDVVNNIGVIAAEDDERQAGAGAVGGRSDAPPVAFDVDDHCRQAGLVELLDKAVRSSRLAASACREDGEGLRDRLRRKDQRLGKNDAVIVFDRCARRQRCGGGAPDVERWRTVHCLLPGFVPSLVSGGHQPASVSW